jgi:hypothetical protein
MIKLHAFLNSALDGGEWSASRSGRFTSWRKRLLYPFLIKYNFPEPEQDKFETW